ncbi:hypothetical protein EGH10_06025 [Brevibacillus laterosporus]|nr:hypothetical protein DM460_15420 [Brevibacillus laterosporus]TPH15976.1 hypothetical protein EGH10_06025 [Brevibacillus laterosporus]
MRFPHAHKKTIDITDVNREESSSKKKSKIRRRNNQNPFTILFIKHNRIVLLLHEKEQGNF